MSGIHLLLLPCHFVIICWGHNLFGVNGTSGDAILVMEHIQKLSGRSGVERCSIDCAAWNGSCLDGRKWRRKIDPDEGFDRHVHS